MPMIARMNRAPFLAACVSLLWLLGAVSGSPVLLGASVVLGLVLPALWSLPRRPPRTRAVLAVGLGIVAMAVTALVLALHPVDFRGPRALVFELAFLGFGALAIPLLYAATFRNRENSDS